MSDLIPLYTDRGVPLPALVALGEDEPSIEDLFVFAREAELRVSSLRLRIEERSWNARGEDIVWHEVLMRHPGKARVTTRRSQEPLSRDYEVWLSDGETIRTYRAASGLASVRPWQPPVVGTQRSDLPGFARTRPVLTQLPAGSVADAFVHPHGLFRNVLISGPLEVLGTTQVAGREAIVVRSSHPRSTKVLTDRPDRRVDVGIDRGTGFLTLLIESVGDDVTHRAEVTSLELDPDIPEEAFRLHLGSDARMMY
ncbi:hypothetical protein BH23CHL8_BH23CHL8_18130 [soil metagenome]